MNLGVWTDNILSFNCRRFSKTLKRVVTSVRFGWWTVQYKSLWNDFLRVNWIWSEILKIAKFMFSSPVGSLSSITPDSMSQEGPQRLLTKAFPTYLRIFLNNNAVAVWSQTYKVLLNAIITKTNTSRPHFPVNVSSFFKIYLLHLKFF